MLKNITSQMLKLGAFYKICSFDGKSMLVRPIIETDKRITFFAIDSESIFECRKPLKNKIEFQKDAIKEELKQFRKQLGKFYRDRYHTPFTGKFYLDAAEISHIPPKLTTEYLTLSSNPKQLKKKIKEDIGLAIESKNIVSKRYKEVIAQFKTSTIKSERTNLYALLKSIRNDKKTAKDKLKQLKQHLKEI